MYYNFECLRTYKEKEQIPNSLISVFDEALYSRAVYDILELYSYGSKLPDKMYVSYKAGIILECLLASVVNCKKSSGLSDNISFFRNSNLLHNIKNLFFLSEKTDNKAIPEQQEKLFEKMEIIRCCRNVADHAKTKKETQEIFDGQGVETILDILAELIINIVLITNGFEIKYDKGSGSVSVRKNYSEKPHIIRSDALSFKYNGVEFRKLLRYPTPFSSKRLYETKQFEQENVFFYGKCLISKLCSKGDANRDSLASTLLKDNPQCGVTSLVETGNTNYTLRAIWLHKKETLLCDYVYLKNEERTRLIADGSDTTEFDINNTIMSLRIVSMLCDTLIGLRNIEDDNFCKIYHRNIHPCSILVDVSDPENIKTRLCFFEKSKLCRRNDAKIQNVKTRPMNEGVDIDNEFTPFKAENYHMDFYGIKSFVMPYILEKYQKGNIDTIICDYMDTYSLVMLLIYLLCYGDIVASKSEADSMSESELIKSRIDNTCTEDLKQFLLTVFKNREKTPVEVIAKPLGVEKIKDGSMPKLNELVKTALELFEEKRGSDNYIASNTVESTGIKTQKQNIIIQPSCIQTNDGVDNDGVDTELVKEQKFGLKKKLFSIFKK